MEVRFGSGCSGVEAATVAWEALGWKAAWFSEIEDFPSAVLAHRRPETPNHGDMTLLRERIGAGEIEAPEVLVAGTPCQAFSLAGNRESLDDDRGQLTLEFVRMVDAVDGRRLDRGLDRCVALWENVPGALSTHDNAFGCLLAGLAGDTEALSPEARPADGESGRFWKWNKAKQAHVLKWPQSGVVHGPTRTVAWRVLDAQYFGVPQRRRRVYVVASARNGFDPAEVLFEFEGMRRYPAPSGEQGNSEGIDHEHTQVHGLWWNGDSVSQTLDAVLYKKQCLPEKNRFPAVLVPAWTPCQDCDEFWCNWHGEHAHDCDCPGLEGWMEAGLFPYEPCLLRYITPREAERLQGFPDDWTRVPVKGREASDTPRYKAMGNSMAAPVMYWIGKRLQDQLERTASYMDALI